MTKPAATTTNTYAMLARDNAEDCRNIMQEILDKQAQVKRLRAELAEKLAIQPELERLAQECE